MKLVTGLFLLYLVVCVQPQVGGMGSRMNDTLNGRTENSTFLQMTSPNRTSLSDSADILSEEFLRYLNINLAVTGIYLPIIITIGVLGNSITVALLYRGVLKSSSSIYLIGLSISDLIYLAGSFPWVFTAYPNVTADLAWKTFYSYYLSYVLPAVLTQFTISVWIIVAFTAERLVVVAFPLKSKYSSSTKRPKIVVGGIYLFGICLNVPRYFVYTVVTTVDPGTQGKYLIPQLTSFGSNPSFRATLFWMSFVINIALPFLIIGTVNIAIVATLATARRNAQHLNSTGNRYPRDQQITRLLLAIVVAFFMCNSLGAVLHVITAVGSLPSYTLIHRTLTLVANSLLTTNTVVNFILYATCSSAMRHAIKDMFCKKLQKKPQRESGVSTTISQTFSTWN